MKNRETILANVQASLSPFMQRFCDTKCFEFLFETFLRWLEADAEDIPLKTQELKLAYDNFTDLCSSDHVKAKRFAEDMALQKKERDLKLLFEKIEYK